MGTETLAIGGGRMFRYAVGTLLLLAGTTLLVAHGLEWLNLEPKLSRALQGGAICAAEIISHFGARPNVDMKALMAAKLG